MSAYCIVYSASHMASLVGLDAIQTGQNGQWAYVFKAKSGETYAYVQSLRGGFQNRVQLVTNLRTNEIVVQKVSYPWVSHGDGTEHVLTELKKDREIRMLDHLNSLVKKPVNTEAKEWTPRWVSYLSYEHASTKIVGKITGPSTGLSQVSYWKLCNGGALGDWVGDCREDEVAFPVSVIARCVAQVCETLEFMYTAGREPVYHCDLHLRNILVHFEGDDCAVPDFYIADFGFARLASESLADTEVRYNREAALEGPGAGADSLTNLTLIPPSHAPPDERRVWDACRFFEGLQLFARPTLRKRYKSMGDEVRGLGQLLKLASWLNDQETVLARRNPSSNPPSLRSMIEKAKEVEKVALQVEVGTPEYKSFADFTRARVQRMFGGKKPFVFTDGSSLPPEKIILLAEKHAEEKKIAGPWSLVEST